MIQDKHKTLEYVCKISNTYEVTPIKVLSAYNRLILKNKHLTQDDVLKVVERYAKMYFNPRYNKITEWTYNEIVDFTKTSMRIRG